jgi:sarcosine oxidase/L-pipecolate oxidase
MRVAEGKGVRRVVGSVKELILKEDGKGVKGVRLEDGTELTADKVVLAAGAWTSSLLSPVENRLEIAERDRIERQARATAVVSAYYKLSSEETSLLAKPKDMPIVVFGKHGEVIPPSEEQTLLKYNLSAFMITNSVATASGRTISIPTTPAKSQYEVPAAVKKEMGRALTSKLLPEYVRDKQPDYWRICWDACTPTEDLLMCQHPHQKLDNLYVAVGGSFSGYK